ncbi:hypothetical protein FRC11_010347 [Ceratobasidium sp. 423]|nr:hypothetical protein FRC11_010347 [Ceratobasidium sp. 423]
MSANNQTAEAGLGLMALVAISLPSFISPHQRLLNIAAWEAYEETMALAMACAEKHPQDFTIDELEELIAKHRREDTLNGGLQGQTTSTPAHPPPPPPLPPQHTHSGVNLNFVN